jgi:hypothetical protein
MGALGGNCLDWLIAGILAAGISWLINSWISSWGGSWSIFALIPLVEEITKTSLALVIGSGIVLTHVVFGTIEAIYELHRDRQIGSAVVALVAHLFFGILTLGIFQYLGSWILAVLGTVTIHSIWNLIIIRIFTKPVGGKAS